MIPRQRCGVFALCQFNDFGDRFHDGETAKRLAKVTKRFGRLIAEPQTDQGDMPDTIEVQASSPSPGFLTRSVAAVKRYPTPIRAGEFQGWNPFGSRLNT